MSKLGNKIDWAINKFNAEMEKADKGNLVNVAKKNIGLLRYIKKIYPNNKFPGWARNSIPECYRNAAEKAGFNF